MPENDGRKHVEACDRCMHAFAEFGPEVQRAIAGEILPDQLATKIRARLCKVGASHWDSLMMGNRWDVVVEAAREKLERSETNRRR